MLLGVMPNSAQLTSITTDIHRNEPHGESRTDVMWYLDDEHDSRQHGRVGNG